MDSAKPMDNKRDQKLEGICRQNNCESLCISTKVDAVLNYMNGTIYAFKGNFFYEIMNENRPQELNKKTIDDYWKVRNTFIFVGPIDAAFVDNNGFTYFFKNDKVYTFKDFLFIEEQNVEEFNQIDSALVVNHINSSFVYIFKGIDYWKILPVKSKYNWNEMLSLFQKKRTDELSPIFPRNYDSIFQDNKNDIIFISDMKYKRIPIRNFPNNITKRDLEERFIYRDLLNCGHNFYSKTKMQSYDQFLFELFKSEQKKLGRDREYNCPTLKPIDHKCVNNSKQIYWPYIWLMVGVVIGVSLTFLLNRVLKYLKKKWKTLRNKSLNTYPKTRFTQNKGIDLINKRDLIIEDI